MENKHLVVISSIIDEWGGSEEIWYHTALAFRKQNIQVSVLLHTVYSNNIKVKNLKEAGVNFYSFNKPFKGRFYNLTKQFIKKRMPAYRPHIGNYMQEIDTLLRQLNPNLVIVNQGVNFDGLLYAFQAYKLKIPYVTISHKAVDFSWPVHNELDAFRIVLKNSRRNFYVSQQNLKQTTAQMAMDIPRSEILFNYIKHRATPVPYPSPNNNYYLYCVGRLWVLDKAQDLLLQVLSQPKWKERPLNIVIVGSGPDEYMLKELCNYYQLERVQFIAHLSQHDMWENAHGLLLPSRSEGLPLVVLEAMAAGRMVITTVAGGSEDWIKSDSGFITYPHAHFINQTLEDAWAVRDQWQAMGENAFNYFNAHYPKNTIEQFVKTIQSILYE
jgi:glycosyltransferase involved in cell wall biosynthesis